TAVIRRSAAVHDYRIELGAVGTACQEPMRLVECLWHGKWYRYLTNVTDPLRLPPEVLLALYAQRWHIEDAFNIVKRLLGLAYFWTGALNGLLVQVWATWVLFAVLVDLTDDVAQALHLPFQAISMEMVFRGLYHLPKPISALMRLTRSPISSNTPAYSASSNVNAKSVLPLNFYT
ncbi:MAG: hypothetical protein ACYDEO_25060, partial [Aggregatilineales bacterium]